MYEKLGKLPTQELESPNKANKSSIRVTEPSDVDHSPFFMAKNESEGHLPILNSE